MSIPRTIRSAVITGATGMIGATLASLLLSRDIRVTALIHPGSKKRDNLPSHPYLDIIEAGMTDYAHINPARQADAFFHLAWMGTYGGSRDDLLLQTENIRCSIEAARLSERYGCSVFVGAGSQAEFKKAGKSLGPEDRAEPDTGYGMAKLAAGMMTRKYCRQHGIAHIWDRFFSIYGPLDNSYTMVMSGIYSLLSGGIPEYTPGDQLWDYLYSEDAARAMLLTAEYGSDEKVYCIGSGSVRPLKEYIELIRRAVGVQAEVRLGARPYFPGQVMRLQADIRRLSEDTGFSPEFTFEEGIKRTVEWARGCLSLKTGKP